MLAIVQTCGIILNSPLLSYSVYILWISLCSKECAGYWECSPALAHQEAALVSSLIAAHSQCVEINRKRRSYDTELHG